MGNAEATKGGVTMFAPRSHGRDALPFNVGINVESDQFVGAFAVGTLQVQWIKASP